MPSEAMASSSASTSSPVLIEEDGVVSVDVLSWAYTLAEAPVAVLSQEDALLDMVNSSHLLRVFTLPPPPLNLSTISTELQLLARAVHDMSTPQNSTLSVMPRHPPSDKPAKPKLLSTVSWEDILWLVHRDGSDLSLVCLCNTANMSVH
jgi:hypothetical protein